MNAVLEYNHAVRLIERLESTRARVGIIGMGYVGQPLALGFAQEGYAVTGFDIDAEKVALLASGRTSIAHIPDGEIAAALRAGARFTTDLGMAEELDALILCLPTPLGPHGEPDLTSLRATVAAVLPRLRPGQVISLESTTYPGTTEEEILPHIKAAGLTPGVDVFVVYSPEREDPGLGGHSTRAIPKLLAGHTAMCTQVGKALYRRVVDRVVPVSSIRAAEMTKLVENIYRAVNIGLVNELKLVADRMGLDIFEIIDAAATKPFGFTPFYPGPGIGGHCIPIDPFYLSWKAREYGLATRFIELSGEVNRAMPDFVLAKTAAALNERGKPLRGARLLMLGVTYKPDVDDLRESPALDLFDRLAAAGAAIAFSDPHVPELSRAGLSLRSVALTADAIASFDAVVLTTDHTAFDYAAIHRHARHIIDTRGRYRLPDNKITRA